MSSILTAFPYPWHDPEALALWKTLYGAVSRQQRAMLITSSAGIDTGLIYADQPPADLWQEILEQAAKSAKMKPLLEKTLADPSVAAAHPFINALLAGGRTAPDSEPGGTGAPIFFAKDDQVMEKEALLFLDDLTISAGRIPWLIKVLEKIEAIVPSVCRLEVSLNNRHKSGTGFRIGKDRILTNWHVLSFEGADPSSVSAEFGLDTDAKGKPVQATLFDCDPNSIRTDKGNDWGVVTVEKPLPDSFPIVDIMAQSALPVLEGLTFIVQHPSGGRKRIAYVRNNITFFNDQVVQYVTDTQVGSSGAPVLNEDGKLIAIHHAGGRPQEVAGKQPVKKNEGIRISRVIEGLQAKGLL